MPIQRLQEFLKEHGTTAETIPHPQAFTAQEVAAAAHVPGKEVAKTVIVKLDDALAMVVLPAPDQLSMQRLKDVTGAQDVSLASEEEFSEVFPSCEVGAMPPFGNLWDMTVFVDERLREDEHIVFRAGTHTEAMRMPYADFERLVGPVVARLSTRA
jgi:Ala-tRNA(Pro) deacylase